MEQWLTQQEKTVKVVVMMHILHKQYPESKAPVTLDQKFLQVALLTRACFVNWFTYNVTSLCDNCNRVDGTNPGFSFVMSGTSRCEVQT